MIKKILSIIIVGLFAVMVPVSTMAATLPPGLSNSYEHIPAPKDIPLFKEIKKIGTALWGIRKVPVAPVKDLKQKLANEKEIKKFANVEEIKKFLNKNIGNAGAYSYARGSFLSLPAMEGGMAVADEAKAESTNSAPLPSGDDADYSRTNVQVAGVDEADILKTDGRYAYAVVGNDVIIIDVYPAADAQILSRISFKDRPQELYINGQNLVVMGADLNIKTNAAYQKFRWRGDFTFFKVFDTSDKKNPKLVRDLSYEGSYYNSRMIGDYAYLLVSNHVYDYFYSSDIVVPRAFNKGAEVRFCEGGVRCPPVYYFDMPYESFNFMNVVAINVRDNVQNPNNNVYLLSDGQSMYMSEKNLYITYPKYLDENELLVEALRDLVYPRLAQEYKSIINKIEATDEQVLTQREKTAKLQSILWRYVNTLADSEHEKFQKDITAKMKEKYKSLSAELEKTVIHKIAVDKEKIEYKVVGEVKGQVLNQYSMDEKDGYFRIATTKNRNWSEYMDESDKESYNNLFVLDSSLKQAGAVEKIAQGERIYSVRFMGDRAYMVTFQQVDPLFVIDLKDPKNPKVAGELKIPGFSNYLHPYDENTLIGLGKETNNADGRVVTGGVKLSLFDVSDITSPKEIDTLVMGENGSYSIAESEPKAFLLAKEKNLLVIPVSLYEKNNDTYPNFSMNAAAVVNVDKSGFTLRAKIDHSDGQIGNQEYWCGGDYYDTTVKRSFYINDTLYSFSSKYLQANELDTLEEIKSLKLESNVDFEVIN